MARNDGGPAFPGTYREGTLTGTVLVQRGGMTLRDYFAGQALVALINHEGASDCTIDEVVHDAYMYADAMLAARAQGSSPRTDTRPTPPEATR